MNLENQNTKEYFKSLQIIYYALVAGQIIFGLLAFFLVKTMSIDVVNQESKVVFQFVVILLVIGGILGSDFLFKSRLKLCKSKSTLVEKMANYRVALIIRYALLEGPSFFAIIVSVLTGDIKYIGMSAVIIVYFMTIKPTNSKLIADLELDENSENIQD